MCSIPYVCGTDSVQAKLCSKNTGLQNSNEVLALVLYHIEIIIIIITAHPQQKTRY